MNSLEKSIQYVKGVGPKRASRLEKLGILTLEDMIYFIPREYEDKSKFKSLSECTIGEKASIKVEVTGVSNIIRPRRNLSILKVPIKNSTCNGYLVWFNQEYLKNKFPIGKKLVVNGKINRNRMELQIMNPVFEEVGAMDKIGRIMPIYALTKGITNNNLIKIVQHIIKNNLNDIEEFVPQDIINKYNLLDRKYAIRNIHFPENQDILEKSRKTLAFSELLVLQLGLFSIKNKKLDKMNAIQFKKTPEINDYIRKLPFSLTKAQRKVFKEIEEDMEKDIQMSRLIQGDVGSGKTVLAVLAMYKAVLSGYQSVMMAPTEILAYQHFESLHNYFMDYNIKCELLVGSISAKRKLEILEELKQGGIDILVGTHAVIQEGVEFNNLGLAITDEQHRFGVKQRATLSQKGKNPDTIVMTATPIPRTLALILYGDLDISIIDELPPGRKKIETYAVGSNMIDRMNNFIRKQILEGRQAYVVCPLIEESEVLKVNSVEKIYKELKDNVFQEFNVVLLHGKMSSKDKDKIMKDFKDNKIQVLVSTTVIEVGVNVPNVNIIAIYNAERFGLAQLHQLRGRVGRGEYQSYCILVNEGRGKIARERMRILEKSNDGFEISEKDLELRGPGEFFGTKQHGIPELKIANLINDMGILRVVQREAREIINMDPQLKWDKHKFLRKRIESMFKTQSEKLMDN
ncbi:MAG TPA: ATP-dependent DNA helicase RecG [Tissierellaceae bacterium]|nr:ATP-dependent DNA helicase RecG [Tissierellaceae bacterium]